MAFQLSREVERAAVATSWVSASEYHDSIHGCNSEGQALELGVSQDSMGDVVLVLVKCDLEAGLLATWGFRANLELLKDVPVGECLRHGGFHDHEEPVPADEGHPAVEVDLFEAKGHPRLTGRRSCAEHALEAATGVASLRSVFLPQLELHILAYGTDVGASKVSSPVGLDVWLESELPDCIKDLHRELRRHEQSMYHQGPSHRHFPPLCGTP